MRAAEQLRRAAAGLQVAIDALEAAEPGLRDIHAGPIGWAKLDVEHSARAVRNVLKSIERGQRGAA